MAHGEPVAEGASRVVGRMRGALRVRGDRERGSLRGEVALVTGGSRGLGYLIARELAREGCSIVICGRDAASLERARRGLESEGARVLAVPADVSDRAQVDALVARAVERFGRVDILVNNAGVIRVGPFGTHALEDYERAMGIMYWGTVYATLAVLPGMLARGSGRVVNITSVGGKVSVPHLLPYGAAKFAAVGFSEGLAAELAGTGVSVTTVVPGLMRTGSHLSIEVSGEQEMEFALFALAASLPLLTISAERAARLIVRAAKRRTAVRIVSPQANLLARFHGLLPGTTVRILGLVSRILPGRRGADTAQARGEDIQRRVGSRLLALATTLGREANRRFQQHG